MKDSTAVRNTRYRIQQIYLAIYRLRKKGLTYKEIGQCFEISGERVREIVVRVEYEGEDRCVKLLNASRKQAIES